MKKWLGLLLLTTSFVYGDIIGIDGLDKPFDSADLIGYDLHVEFETTKYVEGFGLGNQTENNKTYYQERVKALHRHQTNYIRIAPYL